MTLVVKHIDQLRKLLQPIDEDVRESVLAIVALARCTDIELDGESVGRAAEPYLNAMRSKLTTLATALDELE
jgi:hypothetical protein